MSTVIAAAGEHLRAGVALVKLRAVAVEFDFMNPIVTGRRLGMQRRQSGFDESGKGAASNPFQELR